LLVALCAASVSAAEADGGYAGSFLQVPIGARPTAMGGAYIAVSNDGAGALYNPAGLATLKKLMFSSSYRAMQLDRKLGYASLIIPVEGDAALGLQWLYAGSGSVTARDADGYALDHEFSSNNHDFAAVFAKKFEKYVAAGARLNYYVSTIPEVSTNSIGFDVGAMLYVDQLFDRAKRETFPIKDIQLGLTVRNIGYKLPWNSQMYNITYGGVNEGYTQDDRVPIQVGLGASATFFERKLLLASDVIKNEKQAFQFRAGGEYYVVPEFAIRAGYGEKRFTAGTGYIFKFHKNSLAIDYAFSTDRADEGSEHIFSFDFLF
jgi:hypothetical protein